jgi:hypothetical protein
MLKQIINFYLWVIRLFKKQMNPVEIYNELLKLRNTVLGNITEYIKIRAVKGYLKLINNDTENGIVEFKIGEVHFLLKAEIYVYKNQVVYRTFHRSLKLEFFPSLRYKHNLIETLDLITEIDTTHRFKTPKQSRVKYPNSQTLAPVIEMDSEEVANLYLEQVDDWIYDVYEK